MSSFLRMVREIPPHDRPHGYLISGQGIEGVHRGALELRHNQNAVFTYYLERGMCPCSKEQELQISRDPCARRVVERTKAGHLRRCGGLFLLRHEVRVNRRGGHAGLGKSGPDRVRQEMLR